MLNKIKIAVWLNEDMIPQEGGAYSYIHSLLSLLDSNDFENAELTTITYRKTKAHKFKKGTIFLNSYYSFYMNSLKLFRRFFKSSNTLYNFFSLKIDTENDRIIKSLGIDYIYYLNQCQRELKQTKFIATNWDLAHLTLKGFPEFTEDGQLAKRNDWYFNQLPLASAIVVESNAGKEELIKYLNIDESKIQVAPFFIPKTDLSLSIDKVEECLSRNNLDSKHYLYYPAQYWTHKNHLNLISAFEIVVKKQPKLKLLLSGSDKGYLDTIKKHVVNLKLTESVVILGFVSENDKYILLKNAISIVMPSFLGPTNLPPLEAINYNIPVICSNLKGHIEMLGACALYFDPNSISEIANSIETVCDIDFQKRIIPEIEKLKKETKFNYPEALKAHNLLFNNLVKL